MLRLGVRLGAKVLALLPLASFRALLLPTKVSTLAALASVVANGPLAALGIKSTIQNVKITL